MMKPVMRYCVNTDHTSAEQMMYTNTLKYIVDIC